jgi:hypothetical protein
MKMLKQSLFVAALALPLSWSAEPAAAQAASAGSAVEAASEAILANAKAIKALEDIKADDEAAFAEQKRITEIPAPPYKENRRAEYLLKRFVELGFKEASIDAEGNVIALRKGSGGGRPKLVVSAHLDTVFPEGTDVTVKEKDGVILAPGIGDDSRGLAALLSLIKSLNANDIATVGDLMLVGTVGEEELGNLRGVKALFRDHTDIDGFISIDGLGVARVVNQATGSHRYESAERDPCHGPGDSKDFGFADTLRSQDHLYGRHREWRHAHGARWRDQARARGAAGKVKRGKPRPIAASGAQLSPRLLRCHHGEERKLRSKSIRHPVRF